jgi:hypothetical protein
MTYLMLQHSIDPLFPIDEKDEGAKLKYAQSTGVQWTKEQVEQRFCTNKQRKEMVKNITSDRVGTATDKENCVNIAKSVVLANSLNVRDMCKSAPDGFTVEKELLISPVRLF